jgi:hypothetical protein
MGSKFAWLVAQSTSSDASSALPLLPSDATSHCVFKYAGGHPASHRDLCLSLARRMRGCIKGGALRMYQWQYVIFIVLPRVHCTPVGCTRHTLSRLHHANAGCPRNVVCCEPDVLRPTVL